MNKLDKSVKLYNVANKKENINVGKAAVEYVNKRYDSMNKRSVGFLSRVTSNDVTEYLRGCRGQIERERNFVFKVDELTNLKMGKTMHNRNKTKNNATKPRNISLLGGEGDDGNSGRRGKKTGKKNKSTRNLTYKKSSNCESEQSSDEITMPPSRAGHNQCWSHDQIKTFSAKVDNIEHVEVELKKKLSLAEIENNNENTAMERIPKIKLDKVAGNGEEYKVRKGTQNMVNYKQRKIVEFFLNKDNDDNMKIVKQSNVDQVKANIILDSPVYVNKRLQQAAAARPNPEILALSSNSKNGY